MSYPKSQRVTLSVPPLRTPNISGAGAVSQAPARRRDQYPNRTTQYEERCRENRASVVSEQQLERKLKLPHGIAGRQSRDFAECGSTEVIGRRPIKHRVIR